MTGACSSVSNLPPVVLDCGTCDKRKYKSFTRCLVVVAGYLVCTRASCRKGDRIKVWCERCLNISSCFLENSTVQLPWNCLHCTPEGCASTSFVCSQKRHQESAQAGAGLKAGRSNPYHGQPLPMVTPLPALEDQVAAARQQFDDDFRSKYCYKLSHRIVVMPAWNTSKKTFRILIPKQRSRCQWWCA